MSLRSCLTLSPYHCSGCEAPSHHCGGCGTHVFSSPVASPLLRVRGAVPPLRRVRDALDLCTLYAIHNMRVESVYFARTGEIGMYPPPLAAVPDV